MEIKIGPSFFKKEVLNYSNFGQSFFRELLQNSYDAKTSRIDIIIEKKEDFKYLIKFNDDGIGMSAKTLSDVFFTLGATTKCDSSSIGGFSKARIMTHFSSEYYKISTQDCFCEGSGASYNITTGNPYVYGCHMEIMVDAKNRYGDQIDMLQECYDYLGMCQLDCQVFVNGQRFTSWLYKRTKVRELDFGTIHTNKNGTHKNKVLVRVSGILMFSKYTNAKEQVVLEITPEISREVLTSSRDTFSANHSYQKQLDSFLNELAIDTKSALKDRSRKYQLRFGSSCFKNSVRPKKSVFKTRIREQNESNNVFGINVVSTEKERVAACENTSQERVLNTGSENADNDAVPMIFDENLSEVFAQENADCEPKKSNRSYDSVPVITEQNMMIYVDTEDPKVIKAAKTFEWQET